MHKGRLLNEWQRHPMDVDVFTLQVADHNECCRAVAWRLLWISPAHRGSTTSGVDAPIHGLRGEQN